MTSPDAHLGLMRSALREAERALAPGDYPVGAALVCDRRIVAHCGHCAATGADATRHAVLEVLREAAPVLARRRGACELYTTLEPCMMCVAAAAFAGVRRVVFGASDPARGASDSLQHKDFYRSLGVEFLVGLRAAECQALLDGYHARVRPLPGAAPPAAVVPR
jgi:tRNA(adenine34) deaminase